jgi:general secretion pathway protein G
MKQKKNHCSPSQSPLRFSRKRSHLGFTLVEMLLVLVILATLAAIVIPKFAGRSQQAKITAAKSQISSIEIALDAFEVDNGYYPKSGGLDELINQPANASGWKGPYLKNIPPDPWGSNYTYDYPGKHNPNGYDLMSPGPDGRANTDDDINNWDTARK